MSTKDSLACITPKATIHEIISADEHAVELLESIGLSVTEYENETLQSICQQRQWSEVEVLKWVKKHSSSSNGDRSQDDIDTTPDKGYSLKEWTVYLEEIFINSNRALLKEVDNNFSRIYKIHGNQYPWLKDMQWHFNKFKETLKMYLEFEQKKFFPLIERLYNSKAMNINYGTIRELQKSFVIIEHDQDRILRLMKIIQNKGNQFKTPAGGCSTLRIQNKNFKILFSKLKNQFETERDQLIPRVKEAMSKNQ